MLLFTLSSIGLPGLNGFAGEFLVLAGMFQRAWTFEVSPAFEPLRMHLKLIALLAVSGVVLGAWYMLWLIQRLCFGPEREPARPVVSGRPALAPPRDLMWREILGLTPLAIAVFWIGLHPQFFLYRMNSALQQVTAGIEKPLEDRFASGLGPEDRGAAAGAGAEERQTSVR